MKDKDIKPVVKGEVVNLPCGGRIEIGRVHTIGAYVAVPILNGKYHDLPLTIVGEWVYFRKSAIPKLIETLERIASTDKTEW